MGNESLTRCEVMIAGIGGQGVLTAGQLLSGAGTKTYKHISWAPSYGGTKRGGSCECTVILSDEEIASPILDVAQAAIILDGSQLEDYEPRVREGGTIIAESAGLKKEKSREDIDLIKVSGLDIAVQMGDTQINNLILLGAYVGLTKVVDPTDIESELKARQGGREEVLKRNLAAFQKGLEIAESMEK